jgi:predicted small integral membrane protein
MLTRLSKILLIATIALWITLVAIGNLTDYGSNRAFVQHVLAMDTIFPDAGIHYRAIHSAWLQHLAYDLIIAVEVVAACLCWLGAWRMWCARRDRARGFSQAQQFAIAGLSAGLLLWLGGFMAVGGEWFGMWMPSQWNGLKSAFRFIVVPPAALILLGQREHDIHDQQGEAS